MKIVRRVGSTPRQRGSLTGQSCPDIFELEDGNFAVIGTTATSELEAQLPPDASRADYEDIVVVTRQTLLDAARELR